MIGCVSKGSQIAWHVDKNHLTHGQELSAHGRKPYLKISQKIYGEGIFTSFLTSTISFPANIIFSSLFTYSHVGGQTRKLA